MKTKSSFQPLLCFFLSLSLCMFLLVVCTMYSSLCFRIGLYIVDLFSFRFIFCRLCKCFRISLCFIMCKLFKLNEFSNLFFFPHLFNQCIILIYLRNGTLFLAYVRIHDCMITERVIAK